MGRKSRLKRERRAKMAPGRHKISEQFPKLSSGLLDQTSNLVWRDPQKSIGLHNVWTEMRARIVNASPIVEVQRRLKEHHPPSGYRVGEVINIPTPFLFESNMPQGVTSDMWWQPEDGWSPGSTATVTILNNESMAPRRERGSS